MEPVPSRIASRVGQCNCQLTSPRTLWPWLRLNKLPSPIQEASGEKVEPEIHLDPPLNGGHRTSSSERRSPEDEDVKRRSKVPRSSLLSPALPTHAVSCSLPEDAVALQWLLRRKDPFLFSCSPLLPFATIHFLSRSLSVSEEEAARAARSHEGRDRGERWRSAGREPLV